MKALKPVFLRWLLLMSIIGVGSSLAIITGLMAEINRVDITKISFLIYGVFIFFSLRTGKITYQVAGLNRRYYHKIEKLIKKNDTGWFIAECFIAAGMIGTIIGFIMMMSGTFDNVTSANIQKIITIALSKVGLALYTTAAGLVCSLFLRLQLYNLDKFIEH